MLSSLSMHDIVLFFFVVGVVIAAIIHALFAGVTKLYETVKRNSSTPANKENKENKESSDRLSTLQNIEDGLSGRLEELQNMRFSRIKNNVQQPTVVLPKRTSMPPSVKRKL